MTLTLVPNLFLTSCARIPHYALINNAGNVVDKDFKWSETNE
jgi:hypothetical protein